MGPQVYGTVPGSDVRGQLFQERDHAVLRQHELLREQLLRDRRRQQILLRKARQGSDAGGICRPRRPDEGRRVVQSSHEHGRRPHPPGIHVGPYDGRGHDLTGAARHRAAGDSEIHLRTPGTAPRELHDEFRHLLRCHQPDGAGRLRIQVYLRDGRGDERL